MKISKTFIIYALAVVILYLLYKRLGKSYYTSGSKEMTRDDIQKMLNSGTPPLMIIAELIKSGVPSDQAGQMVANAQTPI